MFTIDVIVGARPNFMKIAPLIKELDGSKNFNYRLISTGQHNSSEMSTIFYKIFDIKSPDFSLAQVSGSHSNQISQIINFYDGIIQISKPDLCIVVGDVTSSLACALVAVKSDVRLAHVESGLRSHDRSMPEEINRVLIDAIADFHFTTSLDASQNLIKENKPESNIIMVGNIMIDSFVLVQEKIEKNTIVQDMNLAFKNYGVVTLHRPVNVDSKENLYKILLELHSIAETIPLVFPIHPRTKGRILEFGFENLLDKENLVVCEPLDYINFMSLIRASSIVITDSGGVQEETTFLRIPCLTVREQTERPITTILGTNKLVKISELATTAITTITEPLQGVQIPELWDGYTAKRIVAYLERIFTQDII
jgi:UDP-N-acetylglucosamine 2-epimerase (non-hydrolysing)